MNDKIKIGIATDNYKVDFFKKELTRLGYEYTTGDGLTPDMKMFYIEFEPFGLFKLQGEIMKMNDEARKRSMN